MSAKKTEAIEAPKRREYEIGDVIQQALHGIDAIRKNRPGVGAAARVKGERTRLRPIVAVDRNHPVRVKLGKSRVFVPWSKCTYEARCRG